MVQIESKKGRVHRPPYELYMAFTDLRNLVAMLPEDKKKDVTADYDTIQASVQGMSIGVKVHERVPYSRLELVDYGAPFAFHVVLHFDGISDEPAKTDFHISLEAELNFMMKMLIGSKLQDVVDKIVDSLVDISLGKMPEGFDPSKFGASV